MSVCVLLFVIFHRRLDRVFGQNGTMDFDGRQSQLLGDFAVLQRGGLIERFAFDPFAITDTPCSFVLDDKVMALTDDPTKIDTQNIIGR